MEGGRNYFIHKKSYLVLNKKFPLDVETGEKGQATITGIIDRERVEELADYKEILYKTIRLTDIKLIDRKNIRL